MRLGLHALGIGAGARPEVVRAVAFGAEQHGFATLWSGEHVVMLDAQASRYPYSADGRIAVPADADWLDPLLTLTFAAAVTTRIQLATGVLLLPEHNPVVVAKQAATLDVLSGGRCTLGVGVGWSAEEFAALGVPFAGRGRRTAEYVAALRTLWRDDVSSFAGEFVRFDGIRVYPKPVARGVPVVVGGNSDAALRRVAAFGDGWYGFNVDAAAVPERIAVLAEACRDAGRSPDELRVAVALGDPDPAHLPALAQAGVTEFVVGRRAARRIPPTCRGGSAELAREWAPPARVADHVDVVGVLVGGGRARRRHRGRPGAAGAVRAGARGGHRDRRVGAGRAHPRGGRARAVAPALLARVRAVPPDRRRCSTGSPRAPRASSTSRSTSPSTPTWPAPCTCCAPRRRSRSTARAASCCASRVCRASPNWRLRWPRRCSRERGAPESPDPQLPSAP